MRWAYGRSRPIGGGVMQPILRHSRPLIAKLTIYHSSLHLRQYADQPLMDRVDLTLQILLESHGRPPGNSGLAPLLVDSLRASSVDARGRINDVLQFLAHSCGTSGTVTRIP